MTETLFRAAIEAAPVAMVVLRRGQCFFANKAFAALRSCSGGPCQQACTLTALLPGCAPGELPSAESLHPGEEITRLGALSRAGGSPEDVNVVLKRFDVGDEALLLLTVREVGQEVRMRRLVNHLAFHDSLTELPNRGLLFDRLSQALARMRRENWGFTLMILDLDGFKAVNDHHGHSAGDELLYAVGRRLQACVRASDTVARLGGDEFALLLHGLRSEQEAGLLADKLLRSIAEPFDLGDVQLKVGMSIGIALCPKHGLSLDMLFSRADQAMYHAKEGGKNCYRFSDGTETEENGAPVRMPWLSPVNLGHHGIDSQHARLVEATNGIIEAMVDGRPESGLTERLAEFEHLAREHFAYEEMLMERSQEPGRAEHCQSHAYLLAQWPSLVEQIRSGAFTTSVQYLRKWLLDHIRGADAELVQHLRHHEMGKL